jgi:hypothetical protein
MMGHWKGYPDVSLKKLLCRVLNHWKGSAWRVTVHWKGYLDVSLRRLLCIASDHWKGYSDVSLKRLKWWVTEKAKLTSDGSVTEEWMRISSSLLYSMYACACVACAGATYFQRYAAVGHRSSSFVWVHSRGTCRLDLPTESRIAIQTYKINTRYVIIVRNSMNQIIYTGCRT